MTFRIGLTGGIGSGKTAVSDAFARRGVPIIDTDQLSRACVAPGQPALAEIVAYFGASCLKEGVLQRTYLRERIFADIESRRRLEEILHPRIRERVKKAVDAFTVPYCVIVVPLLIETGMQTQIDRLLVVDVPEALQIQRVMARDGVDIAHVQRILAAQISRAERLKHADDVLENTGNMVALDEQVGLLHQRYLSFC